MLCQPAAEDITPFVADLGVVAADLLLPLRADGRPRLDGEFVRFALDDVVEAVFAQILDDLGVGELRDGAEPGFQDLHRAGVGVLEVDRVPVERFRLDELPLRIVLDALAYSAA